MQIILLERVAKLGQMGDEVTVKSGFARNYLLPQKKALRATQANRARFEAERTVLEAKNLESRAQAETIRQKLDGEIFVIIRQSGDNGQLYGSVNSRNIADTVSDNGFVVDRTQVTLDHPIKNLGLHNVLIRLHPEVEALIKINVARTENEAERQAKGENVILSNMDDDPSQQVTPEEAPTEETATEETTTEEATTEETATEEITTEEATTEETATEEITTEEATTEETATEETTTEEATTEETTTENTVEIAQKQGDDESSQPAS